MGASPHGPGGSWHPWIPAALGALALIKQYFLKFLQKTIFPNFLCNNLTWYKNVKFNIANSWVIKLLTTCRWDECDYVSCGLCNELQENWSYVWQVTGLWIHNHSLLCTKIKGHSFHMGPSLSHISQNQKSTTNHNIFWHFLTF